MRISLVRPGAFSEHLSAKGFGCVRLYRTIFICQLGLRSGELLVNFTLKLKWMFDVTVVFSYCYTYCYERTFIIDTVTVFWRVREFRDYFIQIKRKYDSLACCNESNIFSYRFKAQYYDVGVTMLNNVKCFLWNLTFWKKAVKFWCLSLNSVSFEADFV